MTERNRDILDADPSSQEPADDASETAFARHPLLTLRVFVNQGSSPTLRRNLLRGGKTAYLTADGKSATCMDEERAAYIMCARELSLASVSSEANREFESGLKLEVEGVELDANAQAKLFERAVATWESNADVSKARAEAIRTCKEMLKPSPANTAKAGNPAKAAKP